MTIRDRAAAAIPYAATFAWAFVAFVAAQIAALAVLLWYRHGDLQAILAAPYNGAIVTLSVLVLNPVSVAVLLFASRLRSANPAEYLALVRPRLRGRDHRLGRAVCAHGAGAGRRAGRHAADPLAHRRD